MRKLNQKGSLIIFLTLAFALLGTFIGFAVDFGRAYLQKARISRLVDGAALAAAKVLNGQSGLENDATRAACDSMIMNGAPVVMSGGNSCDATEGAPMTALVEFFDLPVPGGPPVRAVRVTGTEPVSTTFLRFLGWMVPGPGDYSTIDVVARAEAGPERPVDLMLVLDRSGSMDAGTGTPGQSKMFALKTAVNTFLGLQNTFSANDRIGLISFSTRGCGVSGSDSTDRTCVPDVDFDFATDSFISSLQTKVNGLDADGGTNTMEALRTTRPPLAGAFDDTTRATARKAVLLVTDGQPTFMRRDSAAHCKSNPSTGSPFPSGSNGNTNAGAGPTGTFDNGCKQGVNSISRATARRYLFRQPLSSGGNDCLVGISGAYTSTSCPGSPQQGFDSSANDTLYQNVISCTRSLTGCVTNGAMYEANELRNCGYNNSACSPAGEHGVLVFVIAIGRVESSAPQLSLDANAKCLLSRIANATDILNAATGVVETMTTNCNNVFMTIDNDNKADLLQAWPCGTGPCIDTTQQKGKVYTIDVNGDVNAQLQQVFAEIASILKLRLVL